jgi:hypothetical protein
MPMAPSDGSNEIFPSEMYCACTNFFLGEDTTRTSLLEIVGKSREDGQDTSGREHIYSHREEEGRSAWLALRPVKSGELVTRKKRPTAWVPAAGLVCCEEFSLFEEYASIFREEGRNLIPA